MRLSVMMNYVKNEYIGYIKENPDFGFSKDMTLYRNIILNGTEKR